jgi:GrpB-like predicted nucleotidyltransferase (UPF0157 family)
MLPGMSEHPDATDPRQVVIVPYDPSWPGRFELIRDAIQRACGEHLVCIEHVGSTSVPRLAAKPIIDVQPGLQRYEDGFACIDPMQVLGYEYRGEWGISGRHYFIRDASQARLREHVHMLVVGSERWDEMPLFRDYLSAHAAAACDYERLKRDLAERHRCDREAYTEAKTAFVRETLGRAHAWATAGRPVPRQAPRG